MSVDFKEGDIVWVKCGTLFWPAKVVDYNNLPEEIKEDFPEGNPKPKIIAKFFDEDGYEYLFDNKNIFPYNCDRKEEFIKKGIAKSRSKSKEGATSGWFAKFPKDVILSEKLTGGDEQILDKEPFADKPTSKINYKELFGQNSKEKEKEKEEKKVETPKKRKAESSPAKKTPGAGGKKKKEAEKSSTPARPIVHPRFKEGGGSDHQVKILPQPSAPYHIDLQMKQDKMTSAASNSYTCSICGFTATRINVIVLHNKSHSEPAKSNSTPSSSARTPQTPSAKEAKKSTAASSTTPKPSPKKSAAPSTPKSTPKAANAAAKVVASPAASAAAATEATPKRGRGRPPASATASKAAPATTSAASPAASTAKKTPAKPAADATKAKKPRMTKKKKELMLQEKEKKQEERQKIMGEWSEEEEGEVEEKKKINESLGKSDDFSDDDSDREAFLGDDHVHGYDDDDDDEEEEPMQTDEPQKADQVEKKKEEEEESAKATNGDTEEETKEEKETALPEREATPEPEVVPEPEKAKPDVEPEPTEDGVSKESFDIDKVLAETSVPEVSELVNVVKKSVKFSPNLSKEIALKTIRVMQPESNLLDPQDVDDEFAFSEEPKIPDLLSTKTILKRSRAKDSPFKSAPEVISVTSSTTLSASVSSSESASALTPKTGNTVKLTFNAPAEELTDEDREEPPEAPESTFQQEATTSEAEVVQQDEVVQEHEEHQPQHHQIPTQMVLQTSEGQHIQVHNGGDGGDHDGETYILLVDDDDGGAANLESLNSQTLYIDSTSLANGDLSNVVLMTGPPPSAPSVGQVHNQVMTFGDAGHLTATSTTMTAETVTHMEQQ